MSSPRSSLRASCALALAAPLVFVAAPSFAQEMTVEPPAATPPGAPSPMPAEEPTAPTPPATVVAAPDTAPAAPPGGTPAPPPATPRAGDRSDDVRFNDAHADRVVLGATGETHPKGTFFVSDYELLFLQLGYAITDDLQVSVSGVPPFVKNQPYFFDFGLKLNVVRSDSFRAALTGALDVIVPGDNDPKTYYGGRAGAVGQFCFSPTCRSSVSFNVGTFLSSASSDVVPVYGSIGLVANVSPLVSLLAEPAFLSLSGVGDSRVHNGAAFAFDYGVRIANKNFGVDLTFIEPVATTDGAFDNPFILGYPFVAFTYRTDGAARPDRSTTSAASPFANAASAAGPRPF